MGEALRRTALFESHVSLGAKMIDFHGFELPIWYSSIQEEHLDTRRSAGLFDVSHMGFFRFRGEDVRAWLSSVSTQECMKFQPGSCGYCHFLDYNGHIIDDMIFAVSSEAEILGVPNSTMVQIVFDWLSKLLPKDDSISIEDLSETTSIIAIQGPKTEQVLNEILGKENCVRRFRCQKITENELGITGWIQGTGYTGERGFEIFIPNEQSTRLWNALLSHSCVSPVGLGARDTLRMEKGYLLSGQDFLWPEIDLVKGELPDNFLARSTSETSVPYGLDLSHDFVGRDALIQPRNGERLWGMQCVEKGPSPRPGHAIFSGPNEDSEIIGYVTSGAPSPSLGMTGIALGYVETFEGNEVWIQTSSRRRIKSKVKIPPFI